jgi:BA14K-like protein
MTEELRSYVKKIRSDAAECLVLGNIVAEGKREVFVRTAEHLNGLAAQLEKSIATAEAKASLGVSRNDAKADTDLPVANISSPPLQSEKRRRALPWLVGILLGGCVVTALLFAIHPAQVFSFSLQAKPDPEPAPQDKSNQAMLLLFSSEQAERKLIWDRLTELTGRLEGVQNSLDNLKRTRAEAEDSTSTATLPSPKPPVAEQGPSPSTDKAVSTGEAKGGKLVSEANEKPVSAADDVQETEPLRKRSDDFGPPGCNLFRSFDRKTGTYVTLTGQRRKCQ